MNRSRSAWIGIFIPIGMDACLVAFAAMILLTPGGQYPVEPLPFLGALAVLACGRKSIETFEQAEGRSSRFRAVVPFSAAYIGFYARQLGWRAGATVILVRGVALALVLAWFGFAVRVCVSLFGG